MARLPSIPENAPFNLEQRAWLNGFLAGLFYDQADSGPVASESKERVPLLILFGSQTGTAEALARKISVQAGQQNFNARVLDMNAFTSVDWKKESRVLIVTSTWGDGEPPDNAVGFWDYLNSAQGAVLAHLSYSVLALGDSNYASFCGAGKKFDERLGQLGAKRVHPRADCDVDYEETARAWIEAALKAILECGGPSADEKTPGNSEISRELIETVTASPPHSKGISLYDRKNPFPARLLVNRRLNGARSAKDTRHFEICLRDSGLAYEVGDALGVVPRNSPSLVAELLTALKCDGEEAVRNGGPGDMPLRKALQEHFEIRQIGASLVKAFADRTGDAGLRSLLDPVNQRALEEYLHGREVVDLLLEFPGARFAPAEFVSFLRKLNPRLYSISSSPKAHPGEVHLTVSAVRYEAHGRKREGVCSTFLADRADRETAVGVFVQTSNGFRLPATGETPIIMIGPGTGIAPFRAFLEERRAVGATGRNWLFFGDQKRDADFLYRDELEAMRDDGFLTRLDTAFSRDQAEKIYVQNRIHENAGEVWSWLEAGAHVYVCGDAKRMARDVDVALHEVIKAAGGRTDEAAAEYVQKMKANKRYQRDIY